MPDAASDRPLSASTPSSPILNGGPNGPSQESWAPFAQKKQGSYAHLSHNYRAETSHYPNFYHQQQQHQHYQRMSEDYERMMRRRRLSSVSSSSKQQQQQHLMSNGNAVASGSPPSLQPTKTPNTPHHTRRFTTLISDEEPDTTYLWGYLLFFCTMTGFTVSMYALVASNYMPMTGNKILDWIKQDSHYCMLVPVTIPVTVLAVLFNWLGMKLFRHN
ncbi:hypothetical protein BGW38_001059 [Lunasporangiospora selenospora]|uniref:Uncharacterized protein n=1 Tax=Lunasporangiospora selenospora TaxID=979761 RepID=A0A9P6G1M4_9FUNG|nr:hypothetical protein BGW38_001059 [Lunasporangiospora selenospora]